MRAEILCVGTELLLGQIIDTNAAYIASQLARAGIDVLRKQTAGDNLDRIADCISGALSRSEVLVITGGLGPTTDDLTREAIAQAMGVELEHKPDLEEGLKAFFKNRGITPGTTIMRQAYLPQGAEAIHNPVGTAPGVLATALNSRYIFAVPGVPREMRAMVDESIIPYLLERLEGERQIIVSRVLRAFGIGESGLAEPIEDILTSAKNPTVAPLIYGNTEVHLRLTAKARNEPEAKKLLDEMEATLRERVGKFIFGVDDQTVPSVTLDLLKEKSRTLAVAESLTGGVLQSFITDVPGASEVFLGGVIAYSPDVKKSVLGVPASIIEEHTVVSREVAAAMARGAREKLGASIAVSTTGEAGPVTATRSTTGTVFIGLSDGERERTFRREFFGDRDAIRRRASLTAIDIVRRSLLKLSIDE